MRWLDEHRGYYYALGPLGYWTLVVGIVLFCAGFGALVWWLSAKTGWPDAYGFHCLGKGCWLIQLRHSPALLKNPDGYELALFATLWAIPATMGITVVVVLARRALARRRNRIRPMD